MISCTARSPLGPSSCPSFFSWTLAIVLFYSLLAATPSHGLEADEVLVIANGNVPESIDLARYYMHRRSIPPEHLVVLNTTGEETCSRTEYDEQIRRPVKEALSMLFPAKGIRCLVTVHGVPLRISDIPPDRDEQADRQDPPPPDPTTRAAVDSELALIRSVFYPLEGWLPNPYYLGRLPQKTALKRDEVLMVSRLDGPGPQVVRRLVDDAIAAEQQGLVGQACFDARWEKTRLPADAYSLYDHALHRAAALLRDTRLPVLLDTREPLFDRGQCPHPALYCGWYSLGSYTDVFQWQQGSVGYHIASAECSTLRQQEATVWCRQMLEKGISATLGPVFEPYVQAFPPPDLFFATLTEGYLSLGETYLVTLPYLSWQMILVGDPLYRPFRPQR